jgi:hypothetical protein
VRGSQAQLVPIDDAKVFKVRIPVANSVPPNPSRSPLLADALLAEAVREGWVTPPTLADGRVPPRKPIMSFRDLESELNQSREDQ